MGIFSGWRKAEATSGGKLVAVVAYLRTLSADPTPGDGEVIVNAQEVTGVTALGKSLHPGSATQGRFRPTSSAPMQIKWADDCVGFEVYGVGAEVVIGIDNTVTVLTGRPLFATGSLMRQGPGTYQGELWALAVGATGDLRVTVW